MKLGKRLYKSSAISSIKLMAILISIVLFLNLYFQTFSNEHFFQFLDSLNLTKDQASLSIVFKYYLKYPEEFLVYIFAILIPAIYYGFIRGVAFHESGILVNRGIPFFNTKIFYTQIKNYKIVHQKHIIAVKILDTEDEMVFGVKNIDRFIALLDQNGISGNLDRNQNNVKSASLKLIFFFMIVGILMKIRHIISIAACSFETPLYPICIVSLISKRM